MLEIYVTAATSYFYTMSDFSPQSSVFFFFNEVIENTYFYELVIQCPLLGEDRPPFKNENWINVRHLQNCNYSSQTWKLKSEHEYKQSIVKWHAQFRFKWHCRHIWAVSLESKLCMSLYNTMFCRCCTLIRFSFLKGGLSSAKSRYCITS